MIPESNPQDELYQLDLCIEKIGELKCLADKLTAQRDAAVEILREIHQDEIDAAETYAAFGASSWEPSLYFDRIAALLKTEETT